MVQTSPKRGQRKNSHPHCFPTFLPVHTPVYPEMTQNPKPYIHAGLFELRLGPWAYWTSDFVFLGFCKPVGTHISPCDLRCNPPNCRPSNLNPGTSGWQKRNKKACQSDPAGFPQTVCWVWFGPCALNPTP